MNIDNLIEKLINAKSNGATEVSIVDNNWYDYVIEAVEVTDGDEGSKVVIQVGSDW
jgi:hypothetical protein